jgi:hypothetical protein
MKLEKLKGAEIKKNEMISIKGGTSSTTFQQTGVAEMEQETDPKTGENIGKPVLVQIPL